jgi:hypothetical protein
VAGVFMGVHTAAQDFADAVAAHRCTSALSVGSPPCNDADLPQPPARHDSHAELLCLGTGTGLIVWTGRRLRQKGPSAT